MKIAAFVDEKLVYSPEDFVSREEFTHSAIFQKYCNDYRVKIILKEKSGKQPSNFQR
ncbi:MAG: hypothetical protein P1P86_10185 [Bacteroidales bacterium]|nr:hypothetical protein [Bacteroidales bacterium]